MMKNWRHWLFALGVSLLTIHPWLLFGLRGYNSDGDLLVLTAAAKYGLVTLPWYHLLFTSGPGLFITPLLYLFPNPWFFWIGSILLALTMLAGTFAFWYVLRQTLLQPIVTGLVLVLVAFHPFLHQLHYYWMTEWGYVTFLFLAIYQLSYYVLQHQNRHLIWASVFGLLSLLMRPQALLFFEIGALAIAGQAIGQERKRPKIAIYHAVKALIMFGGCAFFLSLPFRWLNHRYHDSWALNKTLGFSVGYYLQNATAYRPSNGPASRQLETWAKQLTGIKKPLGSFDTEPWVKEREDFLLGYAGSLLHEHTFAYVWPKYVHYFFTRKWQEADDFVAQLTQEAIRSNPKKYLAWLAQVRWYFTGKSENPEEWQREFMIDRLLPVYSVTLQLDKGPVSGHSVGGLAFRYPKWLSTYHRLRSLFAHLMTGLKKATFVSLPLLAWFAWRRLPPLAFIFLSLAVPIHLASALAVGMLVGFHHRYSVPFEMFTLYYVACWLALATLWYSKRFTSKY